MKKHYRHETDCLNCGAQLQGKFCHNCGQENLQMKESFGHMLNHAVSDYFHFDAQFFDTLKPLLFKPGKLTADYLEGRRARYLHPVKMYIFISLVYFVLLFRSNHELVQVNDKQLSPTEVSDSIKKSLDKNRHLSKQQKEQIESTLKRLSPHVTYTPGFKKAKAPVVIGFNDDRGKDTTYQQYLASQNKLPADERENGWERFYKKEKFAYTEKYGKNAKEQFFEDLKHNVPKMMFVLLPLFALIIKVAFWKNHKYYVEHLIYAIHLHCYYFLLSAVILVIDLLIPANWEILREWLNAALFFYTVYYIYRSLRIFYQRSRWRTVSKMIGISVMYTFAFVICMAGLVLITVAAL